MPARGRRGVSGRVRRCIVAMAERDSATPSASSPVEKVRAPALHGGDGSCGPRHAPGATAPACCRGLTPHALLAQGAAPRIRQYISALSTYGGHQKLVLRGDETPKKGGGGGSGGGAGAGDPSNQRNVVQQRGRPRTCVLPSISCKEIDVHPRRVRAGPQLRCCRDCAACTRALAV